MNISIAHLSDTHLGFSQYPVTSPSGRPQREQDIVRAFASVVADIATFDPDLVIHSGDFFDKPTVSLRHQKQAQDALARLATRPDGTKRAVVVISGNHDQPADPREPCALELDTPIDGVHIVTVGYQTIDFAPLAAQGLVPQSLAPVVVHAIPHDTLRTLDFTLVEPWEGRVNVLTSHGVVGGTDLYKRTIGREYAIPIDVVTRGWDYVAMGHWHKRGPVAVGGYNDATSPIWYAGSSENCGFSDVAGADGSVGRGYLKVFLDGTGTTPQVQGVDLPVRAMFRLPVIDASDMTPDQVTAAMVAAARDSAIDGAVVSQTVTGVSRDAWALVDVAAARSAASSALWYETRPVFDEMSVEHEEHGEHEGLADLGSTLDQVIATMLDGDPDIDPVTALARQLLGKALSEVSLDASDQNPEPSPVPDEGSDAISDDDAAA